MSSSPARFGEGARSIKKRKLNRHTPTYREEPTVVQDSNQLSSDVSNTKPGKSATSVVKPALQTIYDSEESEDSDIDWEEVDLQANATAAGSAGELRGDLSLILENQEASSRKSGARKRRPITADDRRLRLDIHKLHLLCLLSHAYMRNHWCNDDEAQKSLRKLLSKRTISYLEVSEACPQFQRSRSLLDGLAQANQAFKQHYKITARGMSRSYWANDDEEGAGFAVPDDIGLPMQKPDFRDSARKLEGSRDVGAQLYCTLLRAAGLEARLVCSLQPLSFAFSTKAMVSFKPGFAMIIPHIETRIGMSGDGSTCETDSDVPRRTTASNGISRSRLGSRLGRPSLSSTRPAAASPVPVIETLKKQRIRESPYPVFWVEVFNAAYQKWIAVDSLVTDTVDKPWKLEPPASDMENNMSYVIAFEEDGSARDVTRRYVKAYNGKTRRSRVEATEGGERWWKRVMRMYRKAIGFDRDQVEDAELAQKEAKEEMPKSVQDFKHHPFYALKRHLKRNEAIHPQREVGKVSTGKAKADGSKVVETVYRRRDVYTVKSADSWYRLGREIRLGEQPLKRVKARRKRESVLDDDGNEESAETAMYAAFQTTVYEAPPVINGRIPKNAYGNLDLYVSTMVPPGGAYVPHTDASRAARILGIDYADAVTGFEFRGRHGTAVVKGAVVAVEYQEAVVEVIRSLEYQRVEEQDLRRSLQAVRLWKRFLVGLRIRERIAGYEMEGEADELRTIMDQESNEEECEGFLPDIGHDTASEPMSDRSNRCPTVETTENGGDWNGLAGLAQGNQDNALPDWTKDIVTRPNLSASSKRDYEVGQEESLGGGGFMVEDEAPPALIKHHGFSQSDHAFSPAAEALEKVHSPQQLHGSPNHDGKDWTRKDMEDEKEDDPHIVTSQLNAGLPNVADEVGDAVESDRGSLLSHDPDDEDADPDWLA